MQYIDCIFAKKMLFISFTEAYIAQDTEDPYFFGTIIIDCSQYCAGVIPQEQMQQQLREFCQFFLTEDKPKKK